jgi:3-hydroxy-5-methyl-1-naphthoate 3-O-methyltransferase
MTHDIVRIPKFDPAELIRLRDSIYAADLFIAAVGWLDLFTWLHQNPSAHEDVCSNFNIEKRPADVLLTLLSSMELIFQENGKYFLTEFSEQYLVKTSGRSLIPYFESMKERPGCMELLNVLKTGKPGSWGSKKGEQEWVKAIEHPEAAEKFTEAMASRGAVLAPAMAQQLDLINYKKVLDIAGGSGIYACSIAAANEHVHASVYERSPVDQAAKRSIAAKGMAHKVDVLTGDMIASIPAGFDAHLLSNVLHDWSEETVKIILRHSFNALPPGGMLIIHDSHLNAEKNGPLPVAEYSVLLMYSTEGKCYSVREIENLLKKTGFTDMVFTPTTAWRSMITAKKPK